LAAALLAFLLSSGIQWKSLKAKPAPTKDEADESARPKDETTVQ
jgi:hypothetical protein